LVTQVITPEDRTRLLALARRALDDHVRRGASPPVDVELNITAGAFVSIFWRGQLRGCLGRLSPDVALPSLVVRLAQTVADSDPRFDPVRPDELADITLEISVLTPECEITSVDEIEVGRHGLIIARGSRRGLLLPQVATEHGWDRETFLDHTCTKAGLPAGAWKDGARICVFEAIVFGERDRTGTGLVAHG
jgi:AmmeMemoRadiSam system protein A